MRREFSDAVGIGAGAHGEHLARTARCAHAVWSRAVIAGRHTHHHTLLHDRVAEERQRVAAIAVVLLSLIHISEPTRPY